MAEYHPLRTIDQYPQTESYAQHITDAERRAKECRSAQMPNLTHLGLRDYDNVYEPSDDTYLLIDAIGMDIDTMEGQKSNKEDGGTTLKRSDIKSTLEIGCGTGVPGVYLAMCLRCMGAVQPIKEESTTTANKSKTIDGNGNHVHYVTDINSEAIRIAKATAEKNGIPKSNFQSFQCDLASDILQQLQNKVDILIFNPPYVPTPDEEVGSDGIEASWAGGKNGRVVLDRALPQIAQLLAFPHGVAYIVVVDDNYPEQLSQMMEETYGIQVVPWMRRRARNEFLTILKMTPTREFSSDEGTK
mmetsp:Transcript_25314/g.54472  ORF Transcript_25314/g.54472 Transcript_25314/m.54472 type:complete len:301 (+) Transcript_25314:54-956(+)